MGVARALREWDQRVKRVESNRKWPKTAGSKAAKRHTSTQHKRADPTPPHLTRKQLQEIPRARATKTAKLLRQI